MKKSLIGMALLLVAVMGAASCDEDEPQLPVEPPVEEETGPGTVYASIENPVELSADACAGADGAVWAEGDALALMTSSFKVKYELSEGAGTMDAMFAGERPSGSKPSADAPYYAVYPYSDNSLIDGDSLHFAIPQHQKYNSAGIDPDLWLSVAAVQSFKDTVQLRNICGVLKLSLTGSVSVGRIAVSDLAGNMLWGSCSLALDGNEGTSEQKMTVSEGSNTVYIDFDEPVRADKAMELNLVVPAGSFDSGFSVRVFSDTDMLYCVVAEQEAAVHAERNGIRRASYMMSSNGEPKDVLERGYYKELFIDSGISLNSVTKLPAINILGWKTEYLCTGDSVLQHNVIAGTENDLNGVLLYPDNEPRFRCIYVNGGQSNKHGVSLGKDGRDKFVKFVVNGGGYVGTCAGALLASRGYGQQIITPEYLHIWPGHVYHTGISKSQTDMTVEQGCALLKYYDFGGDMKIDSVRHNGGCYMDETSTIPAGTEILMRYHCPDRSAHGKVSCWAYKHNETEGRMVLIGSHPEDVVDGERRDLMVAMLRYATDGNGIASVKGELVNGEVRNMTDNDTPGYEKIGDGQYHHFCLNIPAGGASDVRIALTSSYSGNLHLSLRKDDLAWKSESDYVLVRTGSTKSLAIKHLDGGVWYVGVYCPDKPKSTLASSSGYYKYSSNTTVLNGVPYSLQAAWN